VDYAAVVRFVESIGDFGADFEDLLDGESAAGNTLVEALAFDAFHDQEICPVLRADIKQGTDIGVVEGGDGFGFALEAEFTRWIGREMYRENFDSNGSLETRVASAVDFAHTTRA